ncbi:MAG: hypothetical protein FD180_3718 [Planctomycetota bacterium]|nr:MAG: hypothetical protein FD180_3718 [Planctomycetota bacterium]
MKGKPEKENGKLTRVASSHTLLFAWVAAILSLPIWFIPARSAWAIPFGVAGMIAVILHVRTIARMQSSGTPLIERYAVGPAGLAGGFAVLRLLISHFNAT